MAEHIASIASSSIPKVDATAFLAAVQQGDLVFCSGADGISEPIEKETNSPFSHVLMAWRPWVFSPWLTLEATIDKGVHVGLLSDYVPGYKGGLALASRPRLTADQIEAELESGFAVLDDTYDWQSEVTFAAHKLLKFFPIDNPKKELYCSGLQQLMTRATPYPIVTSGPIMATPEQVWCDPSVAAKCSLAKASL
jgi:hypothetical protein